MAAASLTISQLGLNANTRGGIIVAAGSRGSFIHTGSGF